MSNQNTPNPDDRSNNVERLKQMAENTKKNIKEAEFGMEFAGPEEAQKIKEKNERRKIKRLIHLLQKCMMKQKHENGENNNLMQAVAKG